MLKNWTTSLPSTTRWLWSTVSLLPTTLSLLGCETVALNFAKYFLYPSHERSLLSSWWSCRTNKLVKSFFPDVRRPDSVQSSLRYLGKKWCDSVTTGRAQAGQGRKWLYSCDFLRLLSKWAGDVLQRVEWPHHHLTQGGSPSKGELWQRSDNESSVLGRLSHSSF